MSKVSETVERLARPIVEAQGCELWSVEYVREAGTWYLRVLIDKDGGVGINDCEAVSRALDPILDEEDPVPSSYVFEVCSAGAERELKRPADFEKFIGREVEVKLYRPLDGRKSLVGTLEEYDGGNLKVSGMELEKEQIAQVKLHVTI